MHTSQQQNNRTKSQRSKSALTQKELKQEFERTGLTDWHIVEAPSIFEGGQASVLGIERSDGLQGVFRFVRLVRQADPQRFLREVKLLTDKRFQHPNIVSILAHSNNSDHLWYVTELGERLDSYWRKRRSELRSKPLLLVSEAIRLINDLLAGLALLHTEGHVHRDIKPENIIVMEGDAIPRPVLIDFGVIYRRDEQRLTNPNDAVGNRAYSPDVMMNRMDEVPPWLDVFEMTQVLIWMICQKPAKNWIRPLHWRWVNYDPLLPNEIALGLRAVTALCSEQSVSPQDASTMRELLGHFFGERLSIEYESRSEEYKAIREAILAAEAEKELGLAEDEALLTACFPTFEYAYAELRNEMSALAAEIASKGIAVRTTIDNDLSNSLQNIRRNKRDGHWGLYNVVFGGDEGRRGFGVHLSLGAYRPSQRSFRGVDWPPHTENVFVLAFSVGDGGVKSVTKYSALLTLSNAGEFRLWNSSYEDQGLISAADFVEMVRAIVLDPARWSTLTRY